MSARIRQKQETRRRIVQVAKRLYAECGAQRLRTAEVAREAGLSHGALFVHFRTREDLLRAVVGETARELTDRLHALAGSGATLREVLEAHVATIAEREAQFRWLLLEFSALPPAERRPWLGFSSAVSFHLARVLDRETSEGHVRAQSPQLLFNTWIGLVHHYVLQPELSAADGSGLAKHGSELVDHFLSLVEVRR